MCEKSVDISILVHMNIHSVILGDGTEIQNHLLLIYFMHRVER